MHCKPTNPNLSMRLLCKRSRWDKSPPASLYSEWQQKAPADLSDHDLLHPGEVIGHLSLGAVGIIDLAECAEAVQCIRLISGGRKLRRSTRHNRSRCPAASAPDHRSASSLTLPPGQSSAAKLFLTGLTQQLELLSVRVKQNMLPLQPGQRQGPVPGKYLCIALIRVLHP